MKSYLLRSFQSALLKMHQEKHMFITCEQPPESPGWWGIKIKVLIQGSTTLKSDMENAKEQQWLLGVSSVLRVCGIAWKMLQFALSLFSFSKADLSCTKFSDIAVNLLMSKEAVDQIRQFK